jgi:diguanylate cyclase (GGDEF)-like protein/PAS domain S-box-containing protein
MRALRFNEQRFRQSLRHSPTGIVMRGLDGKINMVNDAFLKMFGYDWEELRTMTAQQLVHPDDQAESNRDMRSLLDGTANAYVSERRYRHRNGSWVWVRVAVSLVDGDDGAPMHFIGHIESLEAGRRAERDLAEERERLRTTLRAIGEAVITTDAISQITYVNAAAENLIGQRLDEIAGRRLDEVVVLTNPQTMKTTASVFALCVARGASVRRTDRCLLHRPDGSPCYVIDTASPVNDPDGALSGVVVVLQDATAVVERERELSHRAAHDTLTGLTNRFELERRLAESFERYRHIDRSAALLLIDLDRFKAVNDTGGHAAGDEVLRRVAQTLTAIVRESDIVARFGGDEFALLVTHSDPARAELIGAKVLRAIADLMVDWNGATHTVGASIGIASLSPRVGGVSDWIAAADRACYEAKRAGRGQMRIAA